MKVEITGASHFVNRMFEACGSYQWAREFLKNSLEAGATKVEFGIEWQAVAELDVYRRTVIDNGAGMDAAELLRFFSTLGTGAKQIGGVHDNFGVGAKIASLPWNPEGVVVVSYKGGKGSMIWILLDEDSGEYELVEFESASTGRSCVIEPHMVEGIDWSSIKPGWVGDNGTVIVLLGSEEYPDTIRGNPHAGEANIKGLSVYLNSRFWDLATVEVAVVEVRSEKKTQWPRSATDRDDARRPNRRRIEGAQHYLTTAGQKGKLGSFDIVQIDKGRVLAESYLWEGERPMVHANARRSGYIAVRYNGELYELTSNKAHFRLFGVVENEVQQNLTIILEPQHYRTANGRWGVHPDQSRNRLIFSSGAQKGVQIPLSEWGVEWADNMPVPVLEAIRRARKEQVGTIEDEDYRKRLQDKFGDRWTVSALVKARASIPGVQPGTGTGERVEVEVTGTEGNNPRGRRKKNVKRVMEAATPGGNDTTIEHDTPVAVPKFKLAHKDDFERPWHLAMWNPNDKVEGPTVFINMDSPILEEIVKHHQAHYPDVHAEEVQRTIHTAFGEIAACKIAHSQRLTKKIPVEELDADYRNERALTVALMGLLAEETVISQRLGKLGKKKGSGGSAAA